MAPRQKRGQSRQDYRTPPEFLRAVKSKLGIAQFSIDLAASPDNAVCEKYFTEADNSLVQEWNHTGVAWCNPPFNNIRPWVAKACTSHGRVAMLVPASVGANWWKEYVHQKCLVYFLNGRITFVGEKDPYPKDCALLLYSSFSDIGYEVWTWA